ncbi:hypothetical protein K227x_41430 [Rubripirellula lacrimiformis]|uniref:TIGR03067 domain-containing protein n=1 Tax=Rubripirellula lacrimiformis TaxID=1930273 RepID=A0A517NF32_9BACT|nr:TIGR03067 domain-containing protein [Rubripirellula lacrimiformis]QDT05740.1 hypothetical protein K227x_41430 [Rubripirellula lacrimiformis]
MRFEILMIVIASVMVVAGTPQVAGAASPQVVSAASEAVSAASPGADQMQGRDAVQGVWLLSSGEADGNSLPQAALSDGKLVIKADHYTFTMGDAGPLNGTQKLGTSNGLRTIDITDESGDHEHETCLGIYEIEGDQFRVVFAAPGKDRPSKFETAADSGQWMHVWKRVKN